ncbi:hypothetical protein GCM10010347_19590 [Streptomyces cirratus]|uniref:DUF985 domain-containing protein n=1 Tax=Streptomyces cirratus TaxID=68187 RepID=A0ABQ3EPJ6_9ACTN|nr:cupin domain-containing protein [Streptomyces cirratus]GHB50160.1 hypothetical protein GCM10010347_19590 [Streptomyces cirratus]
MPPAHTDGSIRKARAAGSGYQESRPVPGEQPTPFPCDRAARGRLVSPDVADRDARRARGPARSQPFATGIYCLLHPGETSRWHRVRSDELWLWHRGGGNDN